MATFSSGSSRDARCARQWVCPFAPPFLADGACGREARARRNSACLAPQSCETGSWGGHNVNATAGWSPRFRPEPGLWDWDWDWDGGSGRMA